MRTSQSIIWRDSANTHAVTHRHTIGILLAVLGGALILSIIYLVIVRLFTSFIIHLSLILTIVANLYVFPSLSHDFTVLIKICGYLVRLQHTASSNISMVYRSPTLSTDTRS